MLEKLKALALRQEDLETQLGEPTVYGDAEKLRAINRELKEIGPVVEAYKAYQKAEQDRAAAEELLRDPDFRELAQEELDQAKKELERLGEELKILLLPKDPNDSRNVIMELRGGVGGEEGALFAHSLLRMYTMYAQARGWKMDIVSLNETELGGVKECSVLIEG
ncbi:MAG: PCRF domain-containing protein, partial [Oscillibacter sp.]|nr:PCRF domain-containing protein [Oscillibacter sp.]